MLNLTITKKDFADCGKSEYIKGLILNAILNNYFNKKNQ